MNVSRREKILIAVIIVLAMVFIFYKFFYNPVNLQVGQMKNQQAQLQQELAEANREKTLQTNQELRKQKLQNELQTMQIMIPKDKQLAELVRFLQVIAQNSGVQLVSIEFKEDNQAGNQQGSQTAGQPGQVPGARNMTMKVTTWGSYFQSRNFLLLLENCPRIILVQSCALAAQTKAAANVTQASDGNTDNAPPEAPVAKGSRISNKNKSNSASTSTSTTPKLMAWERFDVNKMQMDLTISTYYKSAVAVPKTKQ